MIFKIFLILWWKYHCNSLFILISRLFTSIAINCQKILCTVHYDVHVFAKSFKTSSFNPYPWNLKQISILLIIFNSVLLWNFCFKNNEMQVCLTKIFLVEHQIFAQYATKSWNINPDVKEELYKSLSISQSLHIQEGTENLLIKNQISNQIDRISDEESEKEKGDWKGKEPSNSYYYASSHAENYRSTYSQSP